MLWKLLRQRMVVPVSDYDDKLLMRMVVFVYASGADERPHRRGCEVFEDSSDSPRYVDTPESETLEPS
jgi:hypothetical protein